MLSVYDKKKAGEEAWVQSGKPFVQGYMTDLLHEMSLAGAMPTLVETVNGWMEFDELSDLQFGEGLSEKNRMGTLGSFALPGEQRTFRSALNCSFAEFSTDTLSEFVKTRTEKLSALTGEKEQLPGSIAKVREGLVRNLSSCGVEEPGLQGWDGVKARPLLAHILRRLLEGEMPEPDTRSLHLLQKRFEVQKVLFSVYRKEDLAGGFGPYFDTRVYALLAICLSFCFIEKKNFNYLNSVLKLNDLLLSVLYDHIGSDSVQWVIASIRIELLVLEQCHETN